MNSARTVSALAAGVIGTIVMTIFIYLTPYLGIPKMNIITLLGSMFTIDATAVLFIGTLIHFMMGAFFGLIYVWLWTKIGRAVWYWGAIFGAVQGVIAVIMMPVMSAIHPRATIEVTPLFALGLIVGHIVFGIVVAVVYTLLMSSSKTTTTSPRLQ